MTLQEWIRSQGGQRECARRYELPPASVGAWYRLERFPRPHTQDKLQKFADGEIDFKKLMSDYLRNQEKIRKKVEASDVKTVPDMYGTPEESYRGLFDKEGVIPVQPEWQARIIYASWIGRKISCRHIQRAAQSLKNNRNAYIDLFALDEFISDSHGV